MKKLFFLYFFLSISLVWFSCADDSLTSQLQTEQANLTEQATKVSTAYTKFSQESTQLKELAASVADNPQVTTLLSQYDDINGSLQSMQRWYERSAGTYSNLLKGVEAGTTSAEVVAKKSMDIKEKLTAMNKKANMTIEELGKMKGEIETVIKEVSTAATAE